MRRYWIACCVLAACCFSLSAAAHAREHTATATRSAVQSQLVAPESAHIANTAPANHLDTRTPQTGAIVDEPQRDLFGVVAIGLACLLAAAGTQRTRSRIRARGPPLAFV